MPKLSKRSALLPPSPIRKLARFADAAKSRGTRVIHLNIGQPDIPTPPEFFAAIQRASIKVLEYSPSAGYASLRRAIADYYGRLGHAINAEEVLVTVGASEALSFAFGAIINPGEEVIVPEPFYANYNSFCLEKDARIVPITTRIEDDFSLPDIDAFEAKITPRTRAILICNPGNPTGILYPREALERLGEIAKRHDLFVIADEVYREFVYGSTPQFSTLGLKGLEEHVIVVDSISKRFSACGARIGCLVTRNREIQEATLKMAQARLSPPSFGQIGAEAIYSLPQEYYDGLIKEYSVRRDLLLEELGKIEGVLCPEVNGAFYAMVRLPIDNSDRFCQWLLEEFSHEGNTVMLAPSTGFYVTPGAGRDEVRIAYVLEPEELLKAVRCLSAALACYPGLCVTK